MMKQITQVGWDFINAVAAKYSVNNDCEVDHKKLREVLERLSECDLTTDERDRLGDIWVFLYRRNQGIKRAVKVFLSK